MSFRVSPLVAGLWFSRYLSRFPALIPVRFGRMAASPFAFYRGAAALMAAVQPAQTRALYFVARGDGSSQFSVTLDEHNRAVNRYQRGQ